MIMDKYLLERISMLIGVSVFAMDKNGNIYFASYEDSNPVYYSREFQMRLMKEASDNGFPYVYRDEYEVYFACLSHEENHYFIGPMAERYLDKAQRHKFYKRFDIDETNEKNMRPMTLSDIISATLIFTKIIRQIVINTMN